MRALPALLLAAAVLGATAVHAADLGAAPPAAPPAPLAPAAAALPTDGAACDDPVVRLFPAVWQGHFQGGYSHYLGEGGPIVLDWRDELRCFPSDRSCKRYVAEMRRDFHRPEGYFTCLPIR